MSSRPPAPASIITERRSHVGNRRRNGYELTRQRDMLPIALGAGLAALVLHILAWFYVPSVMLWNNIESLITPEVEAEEEVIRVFVRPPAPKEKEAKDEEPPPPPPEETAVEEEPRLTQVEIDPLDMEQVEQLAIVPGDVGLALPEPTVTAEAPGAADIINPDPIDLGSLPMADPEADLLAAAEPAPANSNEVVANISSQPDEAAEEASAIMEKSLREAASEGSGTMPGDTRSLAELMNIENPGSGSGVARLGADLLFAFDQSQLRSGARNTMHLLAALIYKNPETHFIIEGHTDSFGGEEYNALLSLQRAAAVRDWLMKNGVPVERVYLRACGSSSPLTDVAASKEEQSLNRRVEIHMRRKDEKLPEGCVPHSEAVDTTTPVATQIANGVRVPEAYAAAYGKKKPAATPAKPAAGKTSVPPKKNTGKGKGRGSRNGR